MSSLENALQIGGYFGGISKQKYLDMERRAINGEAVLDIVGRTQDATDFFYDLFDNTNDHSCGIMDTTKTTATSPLTAGDTNLISKVDISTALTKWFQTGQEITIQDDVSKEYVTVTNGGISEESVTYDRSTPTTVVSSAYTTSANCRPQILSNGWIVSCVYDESLSDLVILKSTDKGSSWQQCCRLDGVLTSFSIASIGTMIYVLGHYIGTGVTNYFFSFDAVTVINTTYTNWQNIDSNQSSFGTGCSLAINSTGTYLHATWSSKNSTYPNSFNIRYAKGTIASDGSVTWGSVEQVTTNGTTGDLITPIIIIRSDGNPAVIVQNFNGSYYYIYALVYNGSSWSLNQICSGATYAQYSPDVIRDQNGVLHCVWYGLDSTDTTAYNIRYSNSTDGGITWSTMLKLTSGNTYQQQCPTITFNTNGIYVVWHGRSVTSPTYYQIRMVAFSSSWGTITNLTTNTTNVAWFPSICSNYLNFTDPICIYQDLQAGAVKFRGIFSVITQVPHLEVTALANAYKVNARVYRSLGNVDTVNGRLGFSEGFLSSTTYDVSTPVNVVASAYDTSGNGGRKLVRLSNGNQYAVAKTSTAWYVYKTTDNWNTHSEFKNLTGLTSLQDVCLATNGNCIYIISSIQNASVYFRVFEEDGTQIGLSLNVDSSQTAIGNCSMEADSLGYLHAVWSSKNASYPSSFNLRYSKSMDGGVTWSAVTQITALNTTGTDISNPCIVISKITDYPIIIYQFKNSASVYGIGRVSYNGSNFPVAGYSEVYMGDSYTQSNPSAVVDSAGVIHVVWHGLDSTDTSIHNVRYSKSTDGGVTWSTMLKLTTGNSYHQNFPSITFDDNNNLYVIWTGTSTLGMYQIKKIVYSSNSWGNISTLTTNTTEACLYPSTCSNFHNFTDPLCIYFDRPTGAVKFRGVWTDASYIPFLEEDVRYNITPPEAVSQVVDWTQYDIDAGLSIANVTSLVATSANESYGTPTKKTVVIEAGITAEDQNVYIALANSRITKRLTLQRANTSVIKYVTKVLGALG